MTADDDAIIDTFIASNRRERWRASLRSPSRRRAMLDHLNHCRDIDSRYATLLPSTADVAAILRSRGAPATCYVLSDTAEIDGRVLPLAEAVHAAEQGGWGTILNCVSGKLGFYYDECGERRMLLERKGQAAHTPRASTPAAT